VTSIDWFGPISQPVELLCRPPKFRATVNCIAKPGIGRAARLWSKKMRPGVIEDAEVESPGEQIDARRGIGAIGCRSGS
jgi:hypothetical protein